MSLPAPEVFAADEITGDLSPILPTAIDRDAYAVLVRLQQAGHKAYVVGGCVRDLLLGGTPKDFDIATSARPRQVKKLFRNARIIGRRFRLVHILFAANKTLEVSTFRRDPSAGGVLNEATESAGSPDPGRASDGERDRDRDRDVRRDDRDDGDGVNEGNEGGRNEADLDDAAEKDEEEDLLIREDNVYGTEAEDAVRRDFTINGLFYDVGSQRVIDYVGGVADLRRRVLRTIGDPVRRIREDPIRILRAVKFTTRLDLTLDPDLAAAMSAYHEDLKKSAPPRVFEEILRTLGGVAPHKSVERLVELGVFRVLFPELGLKPRLDEDDGRLARLLARLRALGEIDRGRRSLPTAVYVAVLLYDEIVRRLVGSATPDEGPQLSPSQALDDYLRPIGQRCRMARRDTARMRALFLALRRLDPELEEPGARRRRRGGLGDFMRREFFADALLLMRIVSIAEGRDLAPVAEWERRQQELAQEGPARRPHDHAGRDGHGGHPGRERDPQSGRGHRREPEREPVRERDPTSHSTSHSTSHTPEAPPATDALPDRHRRRRRRRRRGSGTAFGAPTSAEPGGDDDAPV